MNKRFRSSKSKAFYAGDSARSSEPMSSATSSNTSALYAGLFHLTKKKDRNGKINRKKSDLAAPASLPDLTIINNINNPNNNHTTLVHHQKFSETQHQPNQHSYQRQQQPNQQSSVRLVSYKPSTNQNSVANGASQLVNKNDTNNSQEAVVQLYQLENGELEELITYFVNHTIRSVADQNLMRTIALNFIITRDFNVEKALRAHYEYEQIRRREGLQLIWLNEPSLKAELQNPKFTVLPLRFQCPIVIMFTARSHQASKIPTLLALRCFITHLDAIIQSHPDARRWGIVFVYDMNRSKRDNFDFNLGRKIIKLLRDAYPAVLRGFYVVEAPSWFQSAYKVKYVGLSEMYNVLKAFLPPMGIPKSFGGEWDESVDCQERYAHCLRILTDTANHPFINRHYVIQKPVGYWLSMSAMIHKPESFLIDPIKKELPQLRRRSVFRHVQRVGLNDFVRRVATKDGWMSLGYEYEQVKSTSIGRAASKAFRSRMNAHKNRYSDIVCLDHSRVILRESPDGSDYIHANYVDGAESINEYINTQGPMESTFVDFWQMVWEQKVNVIVMVTKTTERGLLKCDRYWPNLPNETIRYADSFVIENISNGQLRGAARDRQCGISDEESVSPDDFVLCVLRINNIYDDTSPSRTVYHLQFLSWPDCGVPEQADSIIALRNAMRHLQQDPGTNGDGSSDGGLAPPIVIHCSAGIGRTGTFCTIDICINSIENCISRMSTSNDETILTKATILSIPEVLVLLRNQRAHSVQNSEQYAFCYEAVFRYVTTRLPYRLTRIILDFVMRLGEDDVDVGIEINDDNNNNDAADSDSDVIVGNFKAKQLQAHRL